jgi:hypothetical protein
MQGLWAFCPRLLPPPAAIDRAASALYANPAARNSAVSQGSIRHMSGFDKREEGFEKQFAHDEELRFKATARRNKLLGLWAADKAGLTGGDAETYAKSVVLADFDEPGDDDVFRKVRADFDAKSIRIGDDEIRRTMVDLMARAIADIKAGK